MNVVLAGGTGLIGKALTQELLRQNHRVILLTRRPQKQESQSMTVVEWDGKTLGPWAAFVDGADAVVNLCGESIAARRWTPAQKEKIIFSRLDPTRVLVQAVSKAQKKPGLFISASAVGYYGSRAEELITESAEPGAGFLAGTCIRWEAEAGKAEEFGTRVVLMRLGMVLDKDAGALSKLLPPFYFFLGGPLGSGKQWMPWIHRDDAVGVVLHFLNTPELQGPVNAVAPEAVTMEKFCATLGEVLGRPSWLRVPALFLKQALGEMSELLLSGQQVVPAKLMRSGYQFQYPNLRNALEAILK